MTTLTLTPRPADAAVEIRIDADRVVRSITRADANGTAPVRTMPGILPFYPPTTEIRRNYIPNPRFLGGPLNGIPAGSLMVTSGSSDTYSTIAAVFSITPGANMPAGSKSGAFWSIPVPASTSKIAAAIAYTRSGPCDAVLLIQGYDAANNVVATGTASNGLGGIITAATGTPTAPVTTIRLTLTATNNTGAATTAPSTVTFTRPVVERAAAAGTYFDGGSIPPDTAETLAHAWAGDPHNSTSIESTYAGSLTLTDYEPADGVVSYTPVGEVSRGTATTVDFALPGPWLYCPILPSYSVRVAAVTDYAAAADSHSTLVDGLGRRDPVVIQREMGSRSGSIELYSGTHRAALDVLDACSRGEVLMLRQPDHDGMDMYFVPRRWSVRSLLTAEAKTVWGTTVEYLEVSRPGGFRAGAIGWTFASLAGAAKTFGDLPNLFDTFEDMRLNKRIGS